MNKPLPLEGVRVLEVASMIFAPMAGQYLGDMGAEVIKVEPPEGDLTRSVGPRRSPKMGAFFLNSNRSKRSIVVDLKRAEGREILQRLLKDTDVLLHSMRTPAADKLGLNYEQLARANPKLVYCHAVGYSDEGAYAGRPAYDDIIQAASGMAKLQSVIGGEPRYIPSVVVDKICGVHAAYGIVLALMHRARTGQGQHVEIPMMETMTAFNMIEHQWGHIFDPPQGKMGYPQVSAGTRRPYRTRDGYISLMPYLDAHWMRFFELAGAPEAKEDERYRTFAQRQKHVVEVWDEVERLAARKSNAEWLALLTEEDIPFAIVQEMDELTRDPHLNSVDFCQVAQHPTEGTLRLPRNPLRLSASPAEIKRLPPGLGEHSVEILRECAFDEQAISSFVEPGGVCAAAL